MIYLDYQATTPLAPEAREAMLRWLGDDGDSFANPASTHKAGRAAAAAVEVARDQVAALLPRGGRVIFTSGATEALNWALFCGARVMPGGVAGLSIEHAASLQCLERLDAVFIAYMELRNLTPENFAAVEALRRRYEDVLETILRDGVAEGVFDVPDPKIATLAVIAMLNGVNTWYRSGGRLSLDEVETIYLDMARRAVLARAPV